ncbi:MAG: energy-coupling factor ABC transporter permease [Elusimicrobiota bacterium]|jgi:cobalt/nickel transport system permease protein|nr:energy-coupling factor ABC transporter permease [Elusimicrobiota bacterium]
MHIPDGFLNSNLASGLLAGAVGILGYCFSKVLKAVTVLVGVLAGNNGQKIAGGHLAFTKSAKQYFQKLAIIAIWIFAFQMFNIPIQSSTSAHLIGGVFAAVLVGPFAGVLVISSVLIVQSFFFGDGGILALGANILNMAFVGSFLSYYIYKALKEKNCYLAVCAACFFSVMMAALFCLFELSMSGKISFMGAFSDMMRLHLVFAVLESAITIVLLKVFYNIMGGQDEENK